MKIRFSTRNHNLWKEKNVPHVKPLPFVGTLLPALRTCMEELDFKRHKKFGRVYGYYDANKPCLMVAEPELVKDLYVQDFNSFTDRPHIETGEDVLSKMLNFLEGNDWKRIRMILSPTFSTRRLKRVMCIFEECAKTLTRSFEKFADSNKPCDVNEMYSSFTMDVIASSAFSTKIDSHNDPSNPFVRHVKRTLNEDPVLRAMLFFAVPSLMRKLGVQLFPKDSQQYLSNTILEIIKQRKQTGQTRNDFLQLLLECSNEIPKEDLKENSSEDIAQNYGTESADHSYFKNISTKSLTMDELVAQCSLFFIAGYHTTTVLLACATYSLALHQEVQENLFEEIKDVLSETKGKLTYEAIQKMKYLDNVMSEALRLHPPATRMDRVSVVDNYTLKGTGISIPKGTTVATPIYAMHRDPELFPDPERFDPDRFSTENRDKIIPYSYLPFGAGPRICIGMRFALLESKICLAYVLSNFQVQTCLETKIPLEYDKGILGMLQPKGMTLRLIKRDDCPLKWS